VDPLNDLYQMDESKDVKPTLFLEGKALSMSGIVDPQVGTEYNMDCVAKVISMNANQADDGTTHNNITLELSRVVVEPTFEQTTYAMFPTMKKP